MSLLNGIHQYGSWCNIYLNSPSEVSKLRNILKLQNIKVSHLIKRNNQIVGLNAKIDEITTLTYINSIKK